MPTNINHKQALEIAKTVAFNRQKQIEEEKKKKKEQNQYASNMEKLTRSLYEKTIKKDTLSADIEAFNKKYAENLEKVKANQYVSPEETEALQKESEALRRRMKAFGAYQKDYGTDNADIIKAADDEVKRFTDINGMLNDQKNVFSSFKDANEYNAYVEAEKERDRLTNNYDLEANKKKLDEMGKTVVKKPTSALSKIGASLKNELGATREYDPQAEAEYNRLLEEYNLAKWYQDDAAYDKLLDNEDFEKESKKAKSSWDFGETAGAANYINGNKISEIAHSIAKHMDKINPFLTNETVEAYERYNHMTDDQVKTFNYIYNTEGQKKAQEYLDHIDKGYLQDLYAEKNKSKNWLKNAGRAIESGIAKIGDAVDIFGHKAVGTIANAVAGEKVYDIDRKIKDVSEASNTELALAARMKDAGKAENFTYDLLQSMPQSALALIPVVGTAIQGAVAGANAYGQATLEGRKETERLLYAAGSGIMEYATNTILTGIGKGKLESALAKKVTEKVANPIAKNILIYGIDAVGEGTEEFVQELAETAMRNEIFGEDKDVDWQNAGRAFLLGAVSSSIMNAPQSGVSLYRDIKLPPLNEKSLESSYDISDSNDVHKKFKVFSAGFESDEQVILAGAIASVSNGDTNGAIKILNDGIKRQKYAKEYASRHFEGVNSGEFYDGKIMQIEGVKDAINSGNFNTEAAKTALTQNTYIWQIGAKHNDEIASVMREKELSNNVIDKVILKDALSKKVFERETGTKIPKGSIATQRAAVKSAHEAYLSALESDAVAQANKYLKSNNTAEDPKRQIANREAAIKALNDEAARLNAELNVERNKDKSVKDKHKIDVLAAEVRLLSKKSDDIFKNNVLSFASRSGKTIVNNTMNPKNESKEEVKSSFSASEDSVKQAWNELDAETREILSSEGSAGRDADGNDVKALSFTQVVSLAQKNLYNGQLVPTQEALDQATTKEEKAELESKVKAIKNKINKLDKYLKTTKAASKEARTYIAGKIHNAVADRSSRVGDFLKKYGVVTNLSEGKTYYYDEKGKSITEEEAAELKKSGGKVYAHNENASNKGWTVLISQALEKGAVPVIGSDGVMTTKSIGYGSGQIRPERAVDILIGHELVHFIKSNGGDNAKNLYKDIINMLSGTKYDKSYELGRRKKGLTPSEDAEQRYNSLKDMYVKAEMKNRNITRAEAERIVTDDYIEEEIAADYVGTLFASDGFINTINAQVGFFRRIWEWLTRLGKSMKAENNQRAERVDLLAEKIKSAVDRSLRHENITTDKEAEVEANEAETKAEEKRISEERKAEAKIARQAKKAAEEVQKSPVAKESTEGEQTVAEDGNGAENSKKMSIVGVNAETADFDMLDKAIEMITAGEDGETVRKATGWFKGYDDRWKYEIDDSVVEWHLDTAKPDPKRLFEFGERIYKLSDILDHEELYKAYPQLRDVTVWVNPDASEGGYVVGRNTDSFAIKSLANTEINKDLIIHEIQHLIQNIEGFAQGASPNQYTYLEWGDKEYDAYEKRNETAKKLYAILRRHGVSIKASDIRAVETAFEVDDGIIQENYFKITNLADSNPRTEALLDEYYKYRNVLNLTTPHGQYMATAGEIEAYDTMARRRMTADQRKNTRPNIDRPDAIVRDVSNVADTAKWMSSAEMDYDPELATLKQQLIYANDNLNKAKIVGSISYENPQFKDKKGAKLWASKELAKWGGQVDRQNFGTIFFSKTDTDYAIEHLKDPYQQTAIALLPYVLKRGKIIGEHNDHKNRSKHTITIAAPIEINGVRGNMGVVVNINGNHAYATRVLLPNNTAFVFSYNHKKTSQGMHQGVLKNESLADTTSEVSIGSISQPSGNVNPQYSLSPETDGIVETTSGDPVAVDEGNGTTKWSLSTYEESGRDTLVEYLNNRVSKADLSQDDVDDIMNSLDEIYDICRGFEDEYATFGAWSRAKVEYDTEGNPVFSVIKANGDYAMNLDFSLVCKKRRALDAVFNRLIEMGKINTFDFGQEQIVQINDIIRDHGFEVACAMCFVDAKRYRQAKVADDFVTIYNNLVKSLDGDNVGIDYFNYGGDESLERVENGIDTLSDEELDFTKIDKVLAGGKEKTVPYKVALHLKNNPQDRKLLSRGDFMSSYGFGEVKKNNPTILSLYNAKKGSGGPKAAFGDVQYLNDIIKSGKFKAKEAFDVGGVRIQSFSDYVARLVFDYAQMVADLSAKGLPAHAYTKEELFVKQFGLTGIKINMSLIPEVGDGKYAGLNADGSYAWAKESFPVEEAYKIQADPEYGRNCGTIAVGVSDEHIRKLLADPSIRMVIPYHKSGINPVVAHMLNIKDFTDYTKMQNTRYKDGTKVSKEIANQAPNFNSLMQEGLSPVEASKKYVEWCEENRYIPKFAQFAYVIKNGQKVFNENYYKLLEDFTTSFNGETVAQKPVEMRFPDESSAFGSMKELIQRGLEEDAITAGNLEGDVDNMVEEISNVLGDNEQGERMSMTEALTEESNDELYLDVVRRTERREQSNNELAGELIKKRSEIKDGSSVENFLRAVIREYGSKARFENVDPVYKEAFNYIYKGTGNKTDAEATEMFRKAAEVIYDESVDNELRQTMRDIRSYEILVPEEVKGEFENYGEFFKNTFGRLQLRNETGKSISEVYSELLKNNPELFSENVTDPADQLRAIGETVQKIREDLENREYSALEKDVIEMITEDLIRGTLNMDASTLRAYKDSKTTKSRYMASMEKLRALISQQNEEFKEKMASKDEKQKLAYEKEMVRKRTKDIAKALFTPTKKHHVPEDMRNDVAWILKKIKAPGTTMKDIEFREELAFGLNGMKIGGSENGSLPTVVQEYFKKHDIIELDKLNSDEMHELSQMLRALNHAITMADKLFHSSESASAAAMSATRQIEVARNLDSKLRATKWLRGASNIIGMSAWDPEGLFNYIGVPELKELYQRIADGQDVYANAMTGFTNELGEIVDGKIPEEWRDEVIEITVSSKRDPIKMTRAQIMSLYLLSKQADSRKRLLDVNGGIEITEKETKTRKRGLVVKQTKLGDKAVLTQGDLDNILSNMDEKMTEVADKIGNMLRTTIADKLNEVSLVVDGYKRFTVNDYFPMMVSDGSKPMQDLLEDARQALLTGKSFTFDRTGTSGVKLVVDDIFSVMDRHILGASQYIGYEAALRDFMKVYEGRYGGTKLKKELSDRLGREITTAIDNFIKGVQGKQMDTGDETLLTEKLFGNYKAAAVALNMSVVAKQPISIVRAMPEFSGKGIKAMAKIPRKADIEEMVRESGLAAMKSWGFSENTNAKSVGQLYDKNSLTWRDKMSDLPVFNWAEKMDMHTWGRIWLACKAETDSIEEARDKFNDVIRKTQVVNTALTSSPVANRDFIRKLMFAFKNEPLKTFNYTRSALQDFIAGKEGSVRHLAKVAALNTLNSMLVAAITTAFSLMRDEEDDDLTVEKIFGKIKENMVEDLVGTMTVFAGDMYSAIDAAFNNRTVERADLAVITDTVQYVRDIMEGRKESKSFFNGVIYDGSKVISSLTGLPINTVLRSFKTTVNNIVAIADDPWIDYNVEKWFYNVDSTKTRARFKEILTEALNEDYATYVKIKNDLIAHGYDQKEIDAAVKNADVFVNAWNEGREAFRNELDKAKKYDPSFKTDYVLPMIESRYKSLVTELFNAIVSGDSKAIDGKTKELLAFNNPNTGRPASESMINKLVLEKLESTLKTEIKNDLVAGYGTPEYEKRVNALLKKYKNFEKVTPEYIDRLAKQVK